MRHHIIAAKSRSCPPSDHRATRRGGIGLYALDSRRGQTPLYQRGFTPAAHRHHGRSRRRRSGVWRDQHWRLRRFEKSHRPGKAHGGQLRHERFHRPDQLVAGKRQRFFGSGVNILSRISVVSFVWFGNSLSNAIYFFGSLCSKYFLADFDNSKIG